MSSNKTIVKNTLFLYFRMLFNMGVSLYTSRVVLQVLGVDDFGIYNLVGGIVVLFSFLNGSLDAATQRFINVEKATGDLEKVNKIFNISLINHAFIGLIVLLLSETVGLWFLNDRLNIPVSRMHAANVVYQVSVLTAVVGIMRTPFNALITAYERMSYFAYVGIFETLAKLGIVYLLQLFTKVDHLILYSMLFIVVEIVTVIILVSYCRKVFYIETRLKFERDYKKIKELLFFSGWTLFGQLSVISVTQGLSMIMNIFHGVVVNAALGIANQVGNSIYGFVSNFQVAFNPQLIQSYASQDHDRNKNLVLNTSKYSFFLIAILSAPVLFFTYSILTLWLDNQLPKYTVEFVRFVILCSLFDSLSGPLIMSINAIGMRALRVSNIVIAILNFTLLPLAYYVLKIGGSPVYVYLAKFLIYVLMFMFRFFLVNKNIGFDRDSIIRYLFGVVPVLLYLIALSFCYNKANGIYSVLSMIINSIFIETPLILFAVLVGLQKKERKMLFNIAISKVRRYRQK